MTIGFITAACDYADKHLIQYGLIDPETLEFKSKDGDGYAIWLECCSAFLAGAEWREGQNRALGLKLSRDLKVKSSLLLSRALLCVNLMVRILIRWRNK